jgi:hypothetical protein
MNELLKTKLNELIEFYNNCGSDSDEFDELFDEVAELFNKLEGEE